MRAALGPSIDEGIPSNISDAALRKRPLAIWVETRLGVTFSQLDQRWLRAKPMTVTGAVATLSADAGRPLEACREALRQLLLTSSVPEKDRISDSQGSESSFFAFQAASVYLRSGPRVSTLERPGSRTVIVDGQQFLPEHPDKRLYPVHFCRECGHEYHPVQLVREEGQRYFLSRDIDDAPPAKADDAPDQSAESTESDGEVFGFLTPHALDEVEFPFDDRNEQYPENWLEFDAAGAARLKPYYRSARAQRFHVASDSRVGAGIPFWFLPGKFRLRLRCGTTVGGASRDRIRLASLSAEGRSSATTVLVASALRWMHGIDSDMDLYTRKMLGFQSQTATLPRSTEVERSIIQRVGQDIFRRGLLEYWNSRCAITDLAVPELLRASHIKPWADCENDSERLDIFNGYLLAPSLDAAFDAGFITVADTGEILVSDLLGKEARGLLGLDQVMKLRGVADEHRRYPFWHRSKVFRRIGA